MRIYSHLVRQVNSVPLTRSPQFLHPIWFRKAWPRIPLTLLIEGVPVEAVSELLLAVRALGE